jgi:hypothetical protein
VNVRVGEWLGVQALVEPRAIRPGALATLEVVLRIPPGGHVQSDEPAEPFLVPTQVRIEEAADLVFCPPEYPPAEVETFAWSPVELRVFRGTVRVGVLFAALSDAAPGPRRIRGRVRYQGCTEALCLPPAERAFETEMTVMAAEEG